MRKINILLVLILLGFTSSLFSQGFRDPWRFSEENHVYGGLGVAWIDDNPFTAITFAPEISFGDFGVGIYLQLLFDANNDFTFRTDEYKGGPGILRIIRYIRYGQKYDQYYLRVGWLDRAILANGSLVWNYNNTSNYDRRKIGLELDFDLDKFGLETVLGGIGAPNVRGISVYLRPFRFMNSAPSILERFKIYGTFVRDSRLPAASGLDTARVALNAYSVGVDLTWLDLPLVKSAIYADYSKFDNYGDGKALGINVLFPNFVGIFGLSARFEKRFIDAQFIPSLFGPLYDLERNVSLVAQIEAAPKSEGYFGELAGHILNRIRLIGNFQKLNGIPNSGILHLEASVPELFPRFQFFGFYDKKNIETFKDARTLDINSVLTAGLRYQLYGAIYATMAYRWYWVEDENNPGVFQPIERFEPGLTLRYDF